MITFEQQWKKSLGFTAMQSITVNKNNIICFNMTDGTIDYFDKETGEKTKNKDIKTPWGHSHHNLATNASMLLAGDVSSKLKLFNNVGEIKNAKAEDNINVIALSANKPLFEIKDIIDVFLKTDFADFKRYNRRIEKLNKYEEGSYSHEC